MTNVKCYWLMWKGGLCPVNRGQLVDVELRSGVVLRDIAGNFVWHNIEYNWPFDIVRFRAVFE